MKELMFAACLLVLTGCQSMRTRPDFHSALVQKLEKRGVSDANTEKIILVGSEGGYGERTQVTVTAEFLIQEIWDTIYQSRPYKTWAASGFRRLRFYADPESEVPAAELLVNVTDRCHFDGDFDDSFRCPGINNILEPLLKAEYEERKGR